MLTCKGTEVYNIYVYVCVCVYHDYLSFMYFVLPLTYYYCITL